MKRLLVEKMPMTVIELKAEQSDSMVEKMDQSTTNKRVVILAGPHKTGSTSIQTNFYEWTSRGILANWTWAAPSKHNLEHNHLAGMAPAKRFAPLLSVLRNDTKFTSHSKNFSKKRALSVYVKAFRDAWKSNQNIVFGAEAIDYVAYNKVNGTRIIEDLIDLMPWNDKENPLEGSVNDITVVVSYRAPRPSPTPNVTLASVGTSWAALLCIYQREIEQVHVQNQFARRGR